MPTILHYNEYDTQLSNMVFSSYSEEYNTVRQYLYSNGKDHKLIPSIYKVNIDTVSKAPTAYVNNSRSSILSKVNPNTLYPIAVRYITKENVYIIERPPFKLSVDFKNAPASYAKDKITPLDIWIPWTVMVLPVSDIISGDPGRLRLFFNDGPIQSLDDTVIHGYLPNSYSDGRICWSNSFNQLISQLNVSGPENIDINYLYSSILNDYMMGGWNTDLQFTYHYLQSPSSRLLHESAKKAYPMLALFANTNSVDKDFAEQLKLILQNSFGLTKRKSTSLVDGSPIGDSHGSTPSRNIFLKLFAFMSLLSLSDTLRFITELKSFVTDNNTRTIKSIANRGSEESYFNTTSYDLYSSSLPIKNTCINYSIDTEYNTMEAIVILDSTLQSGVDYISYAAVHGSNFEDILFNYFTPENNDNPHEYYYLQIYNLCKNYALNKDSSDNSTLVIRIDKESESISVHDEAYLSKFIFNNISTLVKDIDESKIKNIPYRPLVIFIL